MSGRLAIVGQDAGHAPAPKGPVVLQTGFRPFFALAALSALSLVPILLLTLFGHLPLRPTFGPLAWHGHEMIFGFAQAVIAGFLLTAAMVWTGRETARGAKLGALIVLWGLGRLLLLLGPSAQWAAAVVNVAFPLALALAIAGPIYRSRSQRNYGFVPLLLLMAGAEVASFGDAIGYWPGAGPAAHWVALDVVVVMIVVVGGRIIPMFTKNATGCDLRDKNLLDHLGPWSVVVLVPLHALSAPDAWLAGALLMAGLLNLARTYGWGGLTAARQPFVGVLHLGYLGVALGLTLEGAATLVPQLPLHSGRHLIAVGGVAVICLGMMTRVTLGHTGRPLHPPPGTAALYTGLVLAALARVAASLRPDLGAAPLYIAGAAFTASFAGYLALYAAFLWRPRADGKPG